MAKAQQSIVRLGNPSTSVDATPRPWRADKPTEDPDKMRRWGFITAKPSEYLVHVRGGEVRTRSSGQGASCFKWPWDAVSVVPTSLQRLQFRADQVTLEKVGVEVTGFAVYRIADPELAFRVLNFSYPERAQQKLESTLSAMFMGATRRLIANLTVDDCLQKRKSALAHELLTEIAPVVGGQGRPTDATNRGWGVVVDTIEIQEVRVQSEQVFAAMQAPFRAELDGRAHHAHTQAQQAMAGRDANLRQRVEEARLASEMVVGAKQAELERAQVEAARDKALRDGDIKAEIERAAQQSAGTAKAYALELSLEEARQSAAAHVEQQQLVQLRAKAELAAAEILQRLHGAQHQREAAAWAHQQTLQTQQVELQHHEATLRARAALEDAQAAHQVALARAHVITAEKLPELAAAMGERMGEVHITQFGADNPFGSMAQGIAAVLEMAKGLHRP